MYLAAALRAVDLLTRVLPARTQYALADLAGDAWYRAASRRRRLVRANLARVCGADGSPAAARSLRPMVKRAFREHARYYLEIFRVPRYPAAGIEERVTVRGWERFEPLFRRGPVIITTPHLGNFELMGSWLAAHGLRAVAPVEEIRPRALFEFLLARRGGNRNGLEAVPLARSRRRLLAALRAGDTVALVADRDLAHTGHRVSFFGHPTTIPTGPAALALLSRAPIVAGRSLRLGPDRFEITGDLLEYPPGADRRDVAAMTERIARHFETYIRERPEQWFGAFQQIWPDIVP